jgi:fido (protein-threonine AMPylation protein)
LPTARGASDEGAFSFHEEHEPDKLRAVLRGVEFRTTKLLLRNHREPSDWNGAFLVDVHREIFGRLFPADAGRFRQTEALFGKRAGPPPAQIDGLMQQLALKLQDHLSEVRGFPDGQTKYDLAFTHAARDHAEMLRIHPFVDGNGRWGRVATTTFLSDCSLVIGAIVRKADKRAYIEAIDRCIDHDQPGDLANLFARAHVSAIKKRLAWPKAK